MNILAAEKLAEEILQVPPKMLIVYIPRHVSPTEYIVHPTIVTPIMVVAPKDPINAIIAARYAPLVLPSNLNAFPTKGYMKYLPRYNGEGEVTSQENLITFYNFVDNFCIEHSDVWMRLFHRVLMGKRESGLELLQLIPFQT